MHWMKILTPLALSLSLMGMGGSAQALAVGAAPTAADQVLIDMQQAFRKKDRVRLAQLLPQARGHALEPWAAYWELRARLEDAQASEVEVFLQRWAGTYQEDRLRNDWLRLLGQRREWARFAAMHSQFRMGDDREVRCYAVTIAQIEGHPPQDAGPVPTELGEICPLTGRLWFAQILGKQRVGLHSSKRVHDRGQPLVTSHRDQSEILPIFHGRLEPAECGLHRA